MFFESREERQSHVKYFKYRKMRCYASQFPEKKKAKGKQQQKQFAAFLGQGKYTMEILKRFQMLDCKPLATSMVSNFKLSTDLEIDSVDPSLYMQLNGSMMYLMNTRPDICFAIYTLSQFMVKPQESHWKASKHVLRYLKGT
jgi:hypothetical protein